MIAGSCQAFQHWVSMSQAFESVVWQYKTVIYTPSHIASYQRSTETIRSIPGDVLLNQLLHGSQRFTGILFGLVEVISVPNNDVFLSKQEFEKRWLSAGKDIEDLQAIARSVNEVTTRSSITTSSDCINAASNGDNRSPASGVFGAADILQCQPPGSGSVSRPDWRVERRIGPSKRARR